MKKLSQKQREVLSLLLDRYENSKTYEQENRVNQRFAVTPKQVYPHYDSNYEPVDQVHAFEDSMEMLERENLIAIERKRDGVIRKMVLNTQMADTVYRLLGREDKNAILEAQEHFYRDALGDNPIADGFCKEQLERIAARKKAECEPGEAEVLLRLISAIWYNREELLEREISMLVFGDSKTFERSYRRRVVRLFEKYGDFDDLLADIDDVREREIVLLAEFHIFANPSYIYLRGRGEVHFADNSAMSLGGEPVAISSEVIGEITSFTVEAAAIMTVENLTSYHRVRREDTFFLYLAGYHNTAKQKLIVKIAADNPGKEWFHFGDIDPDGFLIADHLKRACGIPLQLWHMDTSDLMHFTKYTKKLTEHDIARAEHMMEEGRHREVLRYMLEHGVKLEQEIISLQFSRYTSSEPDI